MGLKIRLYLSAFFINYAQADPFTCEVKLPFSSFVPYENKKELVRQLQETCKKLRIKVKLSKTFLTDDSPKLILKGIGSEKLNQIWPLVRKITWLKILDLRGNDLVSLPEGLEDLSDLEELYLSDNYLNDNLASLGCLYKLKFLFLDHNHLNKWPEVINDLPFLEKLTLDHNNLTEIPYSIWKLNSLKFLYLDSNDIQDIPIELTHLQQLNVLGLSENRLQQLPLEIKNLIQLQRLYLHENSLHAIPTEIGNLTALRELHLHHNPLESVPASLKNLHNLQDLNLTGCPMLVEEGRNQDEWGKKELKANFSIYVAFSTY